MRHHTRWSMALATLAMATLALAPGCSEDEPADGPPMPPGGEESRAPAADESAGAGGQAAEGWHASLQGVSVPDEPVRGELFGTPFTLERTERHGNDTILLYSEQGQTVFIFPFRQDDETMAGLSRVHLEPAEMGMGVPHIHVHYDTPDGDREVESWMRDYRMRLELGQPQGDELPATLYLCLPEQEQGWLAGTFTVPAEVN